MNHSEKTYWVALKMVDGVGAVSYKLLLDALGSPENVFRATVSELMIVEGIGKKIAFAIRDFNSWDVAESEIVHASQNDVTIVTIHDESYPSALRNIYDAPPFLYVKGHLLPEDNCVALVGSRRASEYGIFATHKLANELAQRGITVVSGLARGIDATAHRATISSRGRTIAVLGCGIDVVYPLENKTLFEKIPLNGAIVSEYPLGTKPNSEHFPARNRIISGMSLGVVVIEATDKSGSLITARFALEQGREVFAVPGPIGNAGSKGTNMLIKNGAKLIECADDIIDELLPQLRFCSSVTENNIADIKVKKQNVDVSQLTSTELSLIEFVSNQKVSIDDIVSELNISVKDALHA
ncbi:MAG: DNA-processing protein DprA, partial [Deltaproteobacteria bacterium]